jgi:4-hydroxybenzoate polyprenyltransferase
VTPTRPTLRGHVEIARPDHWFKNVFVLPGIVAAVGIDRAHVPEGLALRVALGLVAICLVASSNYTINEVLDAPFDRTHPTKRARPMVAGLVSLPLAYLQWLVLAALGIGLALWVDRWFAATLLALWVMGCIYNIPPVRSKDLPYLDVLSESINNPLRMLAGWYLTGTHSIPPASLLLSYWMVGCYFMGMKRYAEYREIGDPARAAGYRKSFAWYTEQRLLVSIMFYGSTAMLFLGAFIMRYRLEMILGFPLVALVMAIYLALAFKPNSAVQRPEGLYREPALMAAMVACAIVLTTLLFVDLPAVHRIFSPTVPTTEQQAAPAP